MCAVKGAGWPSCRTKVHVILIVVEARLGGSSDGPMAIVGLCLIMMGRWQWPKHGHSQLSCYSRVVKLTEHGQAYCRYLVRACEMVVSAGGQACRER